MLRCQTLNDLVSALRTPASRSIAVEQDNLATAGELLVLQWWVVLALLVLTQIIDEDMLQLHGVPIGP